jgi:hypothetical protein
MMDAVARLAKDIRTKLKALRFREPSLPVLRKVLEVAYFASLKTEEGRFTRSSITYAHPTRPDTDPPILRRANYPTFTAFKRRSALTVEELAKLSRAIDKWSASIAVYGKSPSDLKVWGVVDQLLEQSIRQIREGEGGFASPGIVTITMDGVGDLSAYHGDLFLGGLRSHEFVSREDDAFRSDLMWRRVAPTFATSAGHIVRALPEKTDFREMVACLYDSWANTIARLCIGLRRLGTGGAFLLTPEPIMSCLSVNRGLLYTRLADAMVLHVLDQHYSLEMKRRHRVESDNETIQTITALDHSLAEADLLNRQSELSGAIKLTTSMAALDGVVLMTPDLKVLGFGVKIGSAPPATVVYDGSDFARRGTDARRISPSRFGTRHGSILRYCRKDTKALGIIVSQDGHVRIVAKVQRSMVLWDDVKLLNDKDFTLRDAQAYVRMRVRRLRLRERRSLGYTAMPKTMSQLEKRGAR